MVTTTTTVTAEHQQIRKKWQHNYWSFIHFYPINLIFQLMISLCDGEIIEMNFRKWWLLFNLWQCFQHITIYAVFFSTCVAIGMSLNIVCVCVLRDSIEKGNKRKHKWLWPFFFVVLRCVCVLLCMFSRDLCIFSHLSSITYRSYQQCHLFACKSTLFFSALLSLQHCKNSWIACT